MSRAKTSVSGRLILAITVLVAIGASALLIGFSQLSGSNSTSNDAGLYANIPQNGTSLGRSDAPVTISLYEDFQCPFCGRFAREVFPRVVEDYVKPGEVKVVSRPMVFLGQDSVAAAVAALAASRQDRYWQFHSLFFENQGAENSGYVTDDFLTGLAEQTPGLDIADWRNEYENGSFTEELKKVQSETQDEGVDSTPTLIIRGPEGQERITGLEDFQQVSATIDKVSGK